MTRLMKFLMLLALGAVICLPGMAAATLITNTSSFGPGAVTEGFEGITPGSPNTSDKFNTSWFLIGTTPPYNFGNGVSLSAPPAVYNSGSNPPNMGPYIHDYTYGAGTTDILGGNGNIGSAPYGKAYLGIWREQSVGPFHLVFKFDHDVIRAGAYFTGWPENDVGPPTPGTYYLRALDAAGIELESWTISTVNVSSWATHFVGIERLSGFRQLDFSNPTYGQTVIDNLTFQTPLPSTMLLLGGGLLGLVGLGRRVRKS